MNDMFAALLLSVIAMLMLMAWMGIAIALASPLIRTKRS